MRDGDYEAAFLDVRLGAIAANYRAYQRLAGPAAIAGMVKADAYGLGAGMVAPALADAGCDSFFVARLDEGVRLRKLLSSARIFILDGAAPDAVPALISHKLIPVLNSLAEIAGWSAAAQTSRRALDCAIHLDTGMNRLGLPGHELGILAGESAKRLQGLNLVLIMSHLASGDEPESPQNAQQLDRFRTALAMLPPAPASLAASGGAFLGHDYLFDMVRPGIGIYGGHPRPGHGENPFQATAILSARILQLRRIDKGESVGYAATFRAKRPSMIATMALGYADGIPRAAIHRGEAELAGRRVPFAGRISMDLITLDVTDLPDGAVKVGDLAKVFGASVTLDDLAVAAGTNTYEILTGLTARVPRHYSNEGAA